MKYAEEWEEDPQWYAVLQRSCSLLTAELGPRSRVGQPVASREQASERTKSLVANIENGGKCRWPGNASWKLLVVCVRSFANDSWAFLSRPFGHLDVADVIRVR